MAERLSVEQDVVGSSPTSLPLVSLFDEFTSKTEILLRNKEKKEIKNRKFNKFSSNKRKKDSILMSLFFDLRKRGRLYSLKNLYIPGCIMLNLSYQQFPHRERPSLNDISVFDKFLFYFAEVKIIKLSVFFRILNRKQGFLFILILLFMQLLHFFTLGEQVS